jgi:hypothetical protein
VIPQALIDFSRSAYTEKYTMLLRALYIHKRHPDYECNIHETILELFREVEDIEYIDAIVEWVNDNHWEFNAEGCRDVSIWFFDTSIEAIEVALEICVKHKRRDIVGTLKDYMSIIEWTSPWGIGGLGEIAAQSLAQIEEIDAFHSLIGKLRWYHRKWDCGTDIDHRIVGAIASIGKDVIPLIRDYLFDEYGINEGTIAVLNALGEDPGEYYDVNQLNFEHNLELSGDIIRLISQTNRKKAIPQLMQAIFSNRHEASNVGLKKWISDINLNITELELVHCINNSDAEISRGACICAYLFQGPIVNEAVEECVKLKKPNPEAALMIAKTYGIKKVQILIDWIASRLTPDGIQWDYDEMGFDAILEVIRTTAKQIELGGVEIVTNIKSNLESELWNNRASVIILFYIISQKPEGNRLLIKAGLKEFIEGFLARISAIFDISDFADDRLIQIIIDVAIHNEKIPFEITMSQDMLYRLIQESESPLRILSVLETNYLEYDNELASLIAERFIENLPLMKYPWRIPDLADKIYILLDSLEKRYSLASSTNLFLLGSSRRM